MYTKDQEISLIKGYLKGDKTSTIDLLQEGTRLAISVASKEDEIGSASFNEKYLYAIKGFLKALDKYIEAKRYGKDYKFTSYATYFMVK